MNAFDWRGLAKPITKRRNKLQMKRLLKRIADLDRTGATHKTARTLGLNPRYVHQLRRQIAGLPRR